MRRMLGPMLEANVWANMERMLVVRVTGYTMYQMAEHWKQTFDSSHGLHSNIGSIF